mmetsp:Transcript_8845/g.22266  ORF Transcript_8845/g.22266 Transcript_8845/m.22266 type:complete len:457 (-) Transcript_8845:671-2041(-)
MMKLAGHVPPRFAIVLRSVMYDPPMAGSTREAKNVICALNCRELHIACPAVDAMTADQNNIVLCGYLDFNNVSMKISRSGTTVTRHSYARMNCLKGSMCHIFDATSGTMIPSGKMSVGLNKAVVALDRPFSVALRNFTLSLRAVGNRYVTKMTNNHLTAGSLQTAQSRWYVSFKPISEASNSASSSSSSWPSALVVVLSSFLNLASKPTASFLSASLFFDDGISRLKIATIAVVISMKDPINLKNPFKVTRPWSGLLGNPNNGRHIVSLDSASFNAKNPTKLRKYPMFCPIELQIGPRPRFFFDNIVNAHPSTAISCVAIKKYKTKKNVVTPRTFIDADDESVSPPDDVNPNWFSTNCAPKIMISPAADWTGTNHDFLRPKRLKYTASTIGAHNNLSENGQLHKLKIAFALYDARAASDAAAEAASELIAPAAAADPTAAVADAAPAVAAAAAVNF